ncbi:TPA: hypothetical protein MYP09_001417 [Citrobacter farmeri]|nr:hypothetical protein [Citrobacter farmeri]
MKSIHIVLLAAIFLIGSVHAEQSVKEKKAVVKEFKACGNQYKNGSEVPTKNIPCKKNWPASFPG